MNYILTQAGKRLMAEIRAGAQLIITRAEAGAEFASNPEELLSVQNKKQSVQVEETETIEKTTIIHMLLSNLEITEEYVMKQMGIYARSSASNEEVLFIIGQDRYGEKIPALGEQVINFKYTVSLRSENTYSTKIQVNINDFATKGYLQNMISQLVDSNTFIEAGSPVEEN